MRNNVGDDANVGVSVDCNDNNKYGNDDDVNFGVSVDYHDDNNDGNDDDISDVNDVVDSKLDV